MACKRALEEMNGDMKKAIDTMRKKGEIKAMERSERSTGQGLITSYIHGNGKLGVLIHIGCETDFVAKNEEFGQLAKDIAMHIAASNPLTISPDEISHELLEKEREIWRAQLTNEGKKEAMFDTILAGKEKKFREESSLLKQAFVKNPEITIEQLLTTAVTKMGENIKVVRFSRFSI